MRGDYGLRLLTPEESGWTGETRKAWWSPSYGIKEPSIVRHFGTGTTIPAELASLLVPLDEAAAFQGKFRRIKEVELSPVSGYRYETPDDEHSMYFSEAKKSWSAGPWTTDAKFLYYGEAIESRTLVCCNVTSVHVGGQALVSSSKPLLHCEIVWTGGGLRGLRVRSSEPVAVVDEGLFRSLSGRTESVGARFRQDCAPES